MPDNQDTLSSICVDAITGLATAYTWTTATGVVVRIESGSNGVHVSVGGVIHSWAERLDTAVDYAARIAPPADPDLAALLTWTACGKARI